MLTSDQAIAYETKKYQVKKAIKALAAIDLNVTNFEVILEEIDVNCKKDVNYSSISSGSTAASFSGLLENAYLTGISKLESLYLELKRYEVYVQVSGFSFQ